MTTYPLTSVTRIANRPRSALGSPRAARIFAGRVVTSNSRNTSVSTTSRVSESTEASWVTVPPRRARPAVRSISPRSFADETSMWWPCSQAKALVRS